MFSVTPINKNFGAVISGVSLKNCSTIEFERIYRAFLEYQVIFFRDQKLSAHELKSFAQRFGEVEEPHPFFPHVNDEPQVSVIETSRGNPPGKSFWHTDLTWKECPSKCSLLHAQHIPDSGGDTIWVSMIEALKQLPERLKDAIRYSSATHQLAAFANSRYDTLDEFGVGVVEQKSKDYPPVSHPVIVQHPETQSESLFINEQFTRYIEGVAESQSQALLSELFMHAKKTENQLRFHWQVNSLAIWDNRCTQHFAVTDYGDAPRKMHRVTIKGHRPIAAGSS